MRDNSFEKFSQEKNHEVKQLKLYLDGANKPYSKEEREFLGYCIGIFNIYSFNPKLLETCKYLIGKNGLREKIIGYLNKIFISLDNQRIIFFFYKAELFNNEIFAYSDNEVGLVDETIKRDIVSLKEAISYIITELSND